MDLRLILDHYVTQGQSHDHKSPVAEVKTDLKEMCRELGTWKGLN